MLQFEISMGNAGNTIDGQMVSAPTAAGSTTSITAAKSGDVSHVGDGDDISNYEEPGKPFPRTSFQTLSKAGFILGRFLGGF